MTRNVGVGALFLVAGCVLLLFGAGARAVDRLQAKNRVIAILIAVLALTFGDSIDIWTWAGGGFVLAGLGALLGGAGALLVFVGVLPVLIGMVRLVVSIPTRRRNLASGLATIVHKPPGSAPDGSADRGERRP